MNKLLLTLGFATLTLASTHAQGTINPLNGTLTRIRIDDGDGVYSTTLDRAATAADGLRFGLFWGPAGGPADILAGEMTIGATPGILTGLPAIFSVDGWGEEGAVISLRFCAIAGGGLDTGTKQVMLASSGGPGTVVWGTTATDSRFAPTLMNLGGPTCVPEPSTLALAGLACAFLLFRLRKSSKQ